MPPFPQLFRSHPDANHCRKVLLSVHCCHSLIWKAPTTQSIWKYAINLSIHCVSDPILCTAKNSWLMEDVYWALPCNCNMRNNKQCTSTSSYNVCACWAISKHLGPSWTSWLGALHTYTSSYQVYVGELISASVSLSCGVPQGSVLGPIIFHYICYH